jgi:hypothetical protein
MKFELDTSRAICDTCGKPYQAGDATYVIADKYDESIQDRDVLVSFRHWDCHKPLDQVFDELRAKVSEVEDLLRKMR